MFSGLSVSCIGEVVGAFLGGVGSEELADGGDQGFEGSRSGFAEQVLELGEDLFDWVQVGRVFGQEEEFGPRRSNSLANGFAFVAGEIVHDHQIARLERWDQRLLDISLEGFGVDRTIEHPGRLDAILAKGGEEGHGFPMAMGYFGHQPFSARRPSPERLHVGFRPGLIDEHQALGINSVLSICPLKASARDVGAVAFAGLDSFF
jgi:hypothetical protein